MFVITGASDGLGLELAKLLVAKGKPVVSLSRSQPPIAGIFWVETDLTGEASIDTAVQRLTASSERLEALVNCAGILSLEKVEKLSAAELERVVKTNLVGPMLLTSHLMNRIKSDGADIVNVSSTIGTKAYEDQAMYGASKWGLRGFSQNLQLELRNTPCRVISFLPGGIRSNFRQKADGQQLADPENWMSGEDVARFMLQILELPKNMEVSEVIVNRKVIPA